MAGCPVGTAQGWVGQEVSVVEYSQPYPTASTHIQNSPIPHMSTQLRFLVDHTPVGHKNTLHFNVHQLFILVFISLLMIPGGVGSFPFPVQFQDTFFLFSKKEQQKSVSLSFVVYMSAEIKFQSYLIKKVSFVMINNQPLRCLTKLFVG